MERIVGHLDRVDQVAAHGWIANLDASAELEPIICVGADGASAAFRPFLSRMDVCEALQIAGRFGFAIPTRLLRPLGPVLTFTSRTGEALRGGEAVRLPAQARPARRGPCRIVLHIQKTAGTSVRNALLSRYAPGEFALIYPDPYTGLLPEELATLPGPQLRALRLVMGHCSFGVHRTLPQPAEYITLLREPEARLRSNYYHHVAARTPFMLGAIPIAPARVAQHGLVDEFDNLMTRVICGHSWREIPIGQICDLHIQLALQHIRQHFRFIGLAERLEEEFGGLCGVLGIPPPPLPFDNVRRVDDTAALDAAVDWDEVMHRNRFDRILYDRILSEGLHGRDLRARPASA